MNSHASERGRPELTLSPPTNEAAVRVRTGPSPNNEFQKSERGQTMILFALALTVILGFVGLTVDVGLVLHERRQLQNAADAAALAGAQELPASTASAAAVAEQYLASNGVDLTDADYSFEVTTPYQGDGRRIEVSVSHNVEYVFGRVLGLDYADVTARAVAGVGTSDPVALSDASIIALNPNACKSLEVGAGKAFVAEGPIKINSDCPDYAAVFNCDSTALCQAPSGIESVGGILKDSSCNPCNVTTIPHFADPLANVLPPCFPNSPVPCQAVGPLTVRSGTAASPQTMSDPAFDLQPGIYYGGIDYAPSSARTMAPGVYVIAGGGLKLNPSSNFTANGVFIYNTNASCGSCSQGEYGPIFINTGANADLTPMTSGPYAGLLIFQDRSNTEGAVFNPSNNFGEGTIYVPSANILLNPSTDSTIQLIADTVKINNSGSFTAKFDSDKFFKEGGTGGLKLLE